MAISTAQEMEQPQNGNEFDIERAVIPSEYTADEVPAVAQPRQMHAEKLPQPDNVDSAHGLLSCSACTAYELGLCAAKRKKVAEADWPDDMPAFTSTVHTIPARRTICHPKEWSEFVPIICQGWAVSSIALPNGRRQILSFHLSGDFVSTTSLLQPTLGRTVEAITAVTCRRLKRSDLKAYLFAHPDLLEKFARTWIEERTQADQLALDLGRRTSEESIARLIMHLAERLVKRGTMNGATMEFPLRQRHIADATGLTPVHVNKVLGAFQRAGLIEIGSRSLTIVNEAELRRAADWR